MRELYKSASKFSVKHACIIIVIMKVRERRQEYRSCGSGSPLVQESFGPVKPSDVL